MIGRMHYIRPIERRRMMKTMMMSYPPVRSASSIPLRLTFQQQQQYKPKLNDHRWNLHLRPTISTATTTTTTTTTNNTSSTRNWSR
jgi:hypothetical protein